MPVTIHFDPPKNFNLSGYHLGQCVDATGTLNVIASGTDIGSFPLWIDELTWSGNPDYYYAVRFVTDSGFTTTWSERNHGIYGTGFEYFIHQPSGSDTIYLVPPPTSGTATIAEWLDFNTEYTVTIEASGLYASGTYYMEEDYSFSFTTKFNPLWSTVDSVRMSVGPIIDGLPDDTINRMIHKVSWDCITRFFSQTNPYGIDVTSVPEPVYRWVTCAAGLMALNAAMAGGGGMGNTLKRLGSFSVSYDGTTEESAPGEIRKNLNKCMEESGTVIGCTLGTRIQYAIKGISNTRLTHPMADRSWGRMPRKVDDEAPTGPWQGATRDYDTYTGEGTDLDNQDNIISGTYFL